jgi:hypothetical protein
MRTPIALGSSGASSEGEGQWETLVDLSFGRSKLNNRLTIGSDFDTDVPN